MFYSGFAILCLVLGVAFLLGWIWPLAAGIIKTRKGDKSVALIVIGSIWGALAIPAMIFAGFAAFMFFQFSESYQSQEFNIEEYEGTTATLVSSYKGESQLTASSSHDEKRYIFKSTNGTFTLPATVIKPQSYDITQKCEDGKIWTASWSFHTSKGHPEFDLENNSSLEIKKGPPINVKVTRKDGQEEKQVLNLEITDSEGAKVSLQSSIPPNVEILDADRNVVWTHKLEYG
jgi:hypothetical protein